MSKLFLSLAILLTLTSCRMSYHYDMQNPFKREKQKVKPGNAYKQSQQAALLAKYGCGDSDWDEDNQAWLDAGDEEPYPEELRDIDGNGYRDSVDAALAFDSGVGSAYQDSVEAVFGDDCYDDYGDTF